MKNRDVIYIDVDDDITSLIRKLGASEKSIVALVAPRHCVVLQSAVNLKLLSRKAAAKKRNLVLVTSDKATVALAGSVGMYVAKNLQSKPAIPTIDTLTNDDIEEVTLDAVSDKATGKDDDLASKLAKNQEVTEDDLANLDDLNDEPDFKVNNKSNGSKKPNENKKDKKKPKVPNFDGFRKKILLIGGGVVLAVVGVIVYLGVTGRTVVTIHGDTTSEDINFTMQVDSTISKTDVKAQQIKATTATVKKNLSQTFTATGQKDVGTKATGQVAFSASKCGAEDNPFELPASIPAGSTITSNGQSFVTSSTITFVGSNVDGDCYTYSGGNTVVTAANRGGQFNIPSGNFSVAGRPEVSANGSTSGGSSRVVKIITQTDVDKATAALRAQNNNSVSSELNDQFDKDLRILDDTFVQSAGNINVSPAVGDQAANGTVSAQYTFTKMAVNNDDINAILDAILQEKIKDKNTQRIYKNGFDNIQLRPSSKPVATRADFQVSTIGYIGPQFDEDTLKQKITDKKHGQIVSTLQEVPGVSSVDVSITPFWSSKSGDPSRIIIKQDINHNSE